MVMKRNAMRRNLRQSIIRSLGRYIAIAMIIALGAALFVGLLMTKADMVATGQRFMEQQNMFDLRLMNSYGWDWEHLDAVSQMEGIGDAEPVLYMDLIAQTDEVQEDAVYRFIAIPERLNRVSLWGGRMPQAPNECLVEGYNNDDSILGMTVQIQSSNDEDALEAMKQHTLTVVGYVATPLYMDMNRGTTSVGNGSLTGFFYVPSETLDMDYIPEINVIIPGDYDIYTDAYNDAMEAAADELEPKLQILADERLADVRNEAEEEYQEGLNEYKDGLDEYNEKKAEADQELENAYQELLDAEQDIEDNEKLLSDGETQIAEARVSLAGNEMTLANTKADAYAQISKAYNELIRNYKTISESQSEVDEGLQEIEMGLIQLETGIIQLETGLAQIDASIAQVETMIDTIDMSIDNIESTLDRMDGIGDIVIPGLPDSLGYLPAFQNNSGLFALQSDTSLIEEDSNNNQDDSERAELEKRLEELYAQREKYTKQLEDLQSQRAQYSAQLGELYAQKAEVEAKKAELEAIKIELDDGMSAIEMGFVELSAAQIQMQNQFSAAESQIRAGYAQLDAREKEIANGWKRLEEGRQDLADGWVEYEDGKAEAEKEFADAWEELLEGKEELEDARKLIDAMTENDVVILDRNSNIGYTNLDSSSDIVQGVSRVFPVFFILIAALVCITTMTRMIDEERTQIGTLKALGYSNAAIIGKYMIYSGSGAIIGCVVGVTVGSTIFPMILWQAYRIMLYITPGIVLTVNWWLCIAVTVIYTAAMLSVTWYCCRRTLQEEPAELIRPKAPDAGKKILLEYLPIWPKISFLNKVTIRNIFRYRQRLAMMLVGIGGCTALLVTGFGLRDSIVNVVDFQFENITLYDMQVYFREEITESAESDFREEIGSDATYMFYHQSSVELEADNRIKELYMISGDKRLEEYIHLHKGSESLNLPKRNEVVLSVGVAEALGIREGDTVTMRNSDMKALELTVSGIYDNHVHNYAIVDPETIESQWGIYPQMDMAFVTLPDASQAHVVGAAVTELPNVMNVTISEDMAGMVRNMMDALDLVVIVVVFCAGLLAVTVLYNLTNININERVREIATIKVLGFNASETGAYVFKENMTLTVVGSILGLFLGKLLLLFVMTQVKIDMVWFKAIVLPPSYIWAAVLTLFAAVAVDFIFYFKLQKINMAEALKSVE